MLTLVDTKGNMVNLDINMVESFLIDKEKTKFSLRVWRMDEPTLMRLPTDFIITKTEAKIFCEMWVQSHLVRIGAK